MKIGPIAIAKIGKDKWQLRWKDPITKRDVRERVSNRSEDKVIQFARKRADEVDAAAGRINAPVRKVPSIQDGIDLAIELSRARDYTKKAMRSRAKSFTDYLAEHFPSIKTWGDIKPSMLEQFVRALEKAGDERATIVHKLEVPRAAWRRMNRDYPMQVLPLPEIRLPKKKASAPQCLNKAEVEALLDWLKAHYPDLHVMATLMALAGLRVLEAAALRLKDVNFIDGTITITETDYHVPKTPSSFRTLPICSVALDALRDWAAQAKKLMPVTGELFTNSRGAPWSMNGLSHRMTQARREAAGTLPEAKAKSKKRSAAKAPPIAVPGIDLKRIDAIPFDDLRSSFSTRADRAGINDRLTQAYMGHAPKDVMGYHYREIALDDLKQVAAVFEPISRQNVGNNKSAEADKHSKISA